MRGFLSDLYLRPSCYKCVFKTKERASDITVADFWGIDKLHPEYDDDKGMTLLVVHTLKGKELIQLVKSALFIRKVGINEGIKFNQAMVKTPIEHRKRKEFFNRVDSGVDVWKLVDVFTKPSLIRRVKNIIKRVLLR